MEQLRRRFIEGVHSCDLRRENGGDHVQPLLQQRCQALNLQRFRITTHVTAVLADLTSLIVNSVPPCILLLTASKRFVEGEMANTKETCYTKQTGNTCIVMSAKDKPELWLLEPHLGRVIVIR